MKLIYYIEYDTRWSSCHIIIVNSFLKSICNGHAWKIFYLKVVSVVEKYVSHIYICLKLNFAALSIAFLPSRPCQALNVSMTTVSAFFCYWKVLMYSLLARLVCLDVADNMGWFKERCWFCLFVLGFNVSLTLFQSYCDGIPAWDKL